MGARFQSVWVVWDNVTWFVVPFPLSVVHPGRSTSNAQWNYTREQGFLVVFYC